MTLVPHPEREILIMFGGEYFNGAKVSTEVMVMRQ